MDLGEHCYWDQSNEICHGLGACLSEETHECYLRYSFLGNWAPATYDNCFDDTNCTECIESSITSNFEAQCFDVFHDPASARLYSDACGANVVVCLTEARERCIEGSVVGAARKY